MLTNLGKLLFGAGGEEAADGTQASPPALDLHTSEADLGWLLVDVPGHSKPVKSETFRQPSAEERCGVCSCARDASNLPPSTECSCAGGEERVVVGESEDGRLVWCEVPGHAPHLTSQLGESWIVTPPPYFTGSGSGALIVPDPLENRLIEHPSMSVYGEEAPRSDSAHREEEGQQQAVGRADPAAQHVGARQARALRAGVLEALKGARFQERQKQAVAGKPLSRKCLERTNKARLAQSCGKQLSARSRLLRPSGCMNGRRSQRAY